MRTKTLLLTAALSVAGIATSMAQVYSVNAVGYVNKTCDPGYTLIAQPFVVADATVNTILGGPGAGVPDGTTIYTFSGGNFISNNKDEFGSGWQNGGATLDLGAGFFVNNVSGAPFTITFVGEVAQGALSVALPAGYSLVSSKVPQAGFVADLGLNAGLGDTIYKFAGGSFVSYNNDEFGGGWSGPGADSLKGPSVEVAESFFYNNVAGTATFDRNFSVNP